MWNLRRFNPLTFCLATGLFAAGAASAAPTPAQDTLLGSARQQIRLDLRRALELNAAAPTYSEWKQSGYAPEDVLANVAALGKSPAYDLALCEELDKLPAQDLALFENALDESPARPSCSRALLAKTKAYWAETKAQLPAPALQKLATREEALDAKSPIALKPGEVALTFDDGPDPIRTRHILKTLKDAGVRANFFAIGKNALAFSAVPKQAAEEGHIVAAHSWDHADLSRLPISDAETQIQRSRQAVAMSSESRVPFFRVPYGRAEGPLAALLEQKGLIDIPYTLDSQDWKIRDPHALSARIVKQLEEKRSGVLLLHENEEQTVLMLPHLLQELKARNFTAVVFVPR